MAFWKRLARVIGLEAPLTNIAAGQTAPGFSLKALDGKEYSLEKLLQRGPVVAGFFKVSCPVCQFTFPFLQRLHQRYAGEAATVIGVSQDDAKSTIEFNREYGVTFPTLVDGAGCPASNAYGLTNVPTVFLITPDGRVQVSSVGFSKSDMEKIASELSHSKKVRGAPLFLPEEVVPAYKPG